MVNKSSLDQALMECVRCLSPENLRQARELLAHQKDGDSVLQQFLETAYREQDWNAMQSLVACAFAKPSDVYVPILCNLLESANPELNIEDVANLLGEIASSDSVFTLSNLVERDFPSDEGHFVNQKIIWALGKIRTPEAIQVLHKAAQSQTETIREEAERQLDWIINRSE